MAAPIDSPINEINVPFQNPKKRILAVVIKKLGTTPIIAMRRLMPILMMMDS
jgi:hypothetical protein